MTIGSSASSGRYTFSISVRKLWADCLNSLSLISCSNWILIIDRPSAEDEVIVLMLSTSEISSSIGLVISFSISSGDTPGYQTSTIIQ